MGYKGSILGGSWDLVSTVISTLSGVISNYKYSYLNIIALVTKSHDPLSKDSMKSRASRCLGFGARVFNWTFEVSAPWT